MYDLKWSATEKKIARCAYEAALESALAKIMAEFKVMAAAAATPAEMWETEDYLRRQRREITETFDYRYSRLAFAFAWLIRGGHWDEAQLCGLSEERLAIIRHFLSRMAAG